MKGDQVLVESRPGAPGAGHKTKNVVVVIPIPNDPDWSIFEQLSEETSIIVVDDSDGKLSPAPRRNVRFFDYNAQRAIMGEHYPAIPHKSAATRNFGRAESVAIDTPYGFGAGSGGGAPTPDEPKNSVRPSANVRFVPLARDAPSLA